jgi:predicted MPP superfamily phosphohydrolase
MAKPDVVPAKADLQPAPPRTPERTVLDIVREEQPDIVVVTGDSVTSKARCEVAHATFDAPLGVWGVPGNWEYDVSGWYGQGQRRM